MFHVSHQLLPFRNMIMVATLKGRLWSTRPWVLTSRAFELPQGCLWGCLLRRRALASLLCPNLNGVWHALAPKTCLRLLPASASKSRTCSQVCSRPETLQTGGSAGVPFQKWRPQEQRPSKSTRVRQTLLKQTRRYRASVPTASELERYPSAFHGCLTVHVSLCCVEQVARRSRPFGTLVGQCGERILRAVFVRRSLLPRQIAKSERESRSVSRPDIAKRT